MKGKRAVVLGGRRLHGFHLCERLLRTARRVVASTTSSPAARRTSAPRREPRFEHVKQDISEPLDLDGPLDFVFNLASPASPIDYAQLPLETLRVAPSARRTR